MPLKDREARLAYQREWYAKHRKRVIKKVAARKWSKYGGVCRFCGAETIGETKGQAATFCQKPECRSAHNKEHPEIFSAASYKRHSMRKAKHRRKLRDQQVVSLDDLAKGY